MRQYESILAMKHRSVTADTHVSSALASKIDIFRGLAGGIIIHNSINAICDVAFRKKSNTGRMVVK